MALPDPQQDDPRHRWMGVVAMGLAGLVACAPDLEPKLGSFVERGEHIEVWASDGIEVCGGNVEHMDRFIERFREIVGEPPEAERHRYYVLDDENYEHTPCGELSKGCVADHDAYARLVIPLTHELVHAEIYGEHDSFLEEGIAVAFGDPEIGGHPVRGTVEEGLEVVGSLLPYEYYEIAGHFTRFMIDRWGVDGFLRVRKLTSYDSNYDDVDQAFRTALSVQLDDELKEHDGYPTLCVNAGYRFPMLECAIEPSPWTDDATFVESVDLSCSSPDVLGPFHGEIFTLRAFEIMELARYDVEFEAQGAEEASTWITKCDSECAELPREDREYPYEPAQIAVEIREGIPHDLLLYPGKYWIRMARPVEQPGPATLTVTARPN